MVIEVLKRRLRSSPAIQPLDRADLQGLVLDTFEDLPAATFVFLNIAQRSQAQTWLSKIEPTSAQATPGPGRMSAVNVAFSWPGLAALVGSGSIAFSPREFSEGMVTEHRSRILGDTAANAPDRWQWRADNGGAASSSVVHVLLMLYGKTRSEVQRMLERWLGRPDNDGVVVVGKLDSDLLPDRKEHFGFRDGIGQPTIAGEGPGTTDNPAIASGEFVLGYPNAYGVASMSPAVPSELDPAGILEPSPLAEDHRDLGKNGSFMVFRQLEQDVAGFWTSLERAVGPGTPGATALAAKMVGRWPSGAAIVLHPEGDPGRVPDTNEFGYAAADASGRLVPIGSHIRRANPRDALVENAGESMSMVSHHRIIRRSRPYGAPVDPGLVPAAMARAHPDGEQRGLAFICLNSDLGRQFEFIQHAWLNSPKFGGLYEDASPFLGDGEPNSVASTFTVPAAPVRKEHPGFEQFVTVRGGGYFFLPGIRAFRFLAEPTR